MREFSEKSRRRLAFVAANAKVDWRSMATLTYPREYPADGRTVKAHLNGMLTNLRKQRALDHYIWFLEFQARGAPHIHILMDIMPANAECLSWLSRIWYGIVASNDERHLAAGTNWRLPIRGTRGVVGYAVKYAQKMRQKEVPATFRNPGRFWGTSRGLPGFRNAKISITESQLRALLSGWDRMSDDHIYKCLYNAGEHLRLKGYHQQDLLAALGECDPDDYLWRPWERKGEFKMPLEEGEIPF